MKNELRSNWFTDFMDCVEIDVEASNINVDLVRENLTREAELQVESATKEKSKLDWYNLYRVKGKVCYIESRTYRSVTCKLLAGCLKLQVEVDRYRGPSA